MSFANLRLSLTIGLAATVLLFGSSNAETTVRYGEARNFRQEQILLALGNGNSVNVVFDKPVKELPEQINRLLSEVAGHGNQVRIKDVTPGFDVLQAFDLFNFARKAIKGFIADLKEPELRDYNAIVRGTFSKAGTKIFEVSFIPKESEDWKQRCPGTRVLSDVALLASDDTADAETSSFDEDVPC